MVEMKSLLRLFDREFVARSYLLIMLFSLVLLADGFVLVLLSRIYGVFFVLAMEATTGFVGFIIVLDATSRRLALLRRKVRAGIYPKSEFCTLFAGLLAGLLLIIPGFVTDVLGVIVLVPGIRYLVGLGLTSRMKDRLREIYEYLKLSEFESAPKLVKKSRLT